MIGNICNCNSDETLMVYINGYSKTFKQMALFKFLPMGLNFNPYSMVNIIEIKGAASISGVHISMDSRKECAIIVEYHN